MPFNGGGSFSPPGASFPAVANTLIEAVKFNAVINDIATNGLSNCITKDGQTTVTANIPMGGNKLTGLGAATTNGDAVRYEQVIGAFLQITGGTLTGNLLFTDATYDIGASGATRPRDLFLSRNLTANGIALVQTLSVSGHATLEGVTSTGATGTGKIVYDGSPTLVTPTLGAATATSLTGSVIATQADQETATSVTTVVTPGRQHFHPGSAKAWGKVTAATTVDASYPAAGVSVNNSGTGVYVVTHGLTMSSSNYVVVVTLTGSSLIRFVLVGSQNATTFTLNAFDSATMAANVSGFEYVVYGDL